MATINPSKHSLVIKEKVVKLKTFSLYSASIGPFAGCHESVDPDVFYETCVYDMCAIPGNESLCDNLENFARKCVENGGELEEWRSEDLCRKLFLHCFYLFEFFILQQNGPICIGAMVKRVESVSDSLIWCLLNVPYSCGLCATCSLQTIDISMSCNLCRSRCREKLL